MLVNWWVFCLSSFGWGRAPLPPGIIYLLLAQEAKYVESWPNMTSAWADWSRFDIPVDRYGGVHALILCTGDFYLPLG